MNRRTAITAEQTAALESAARVACGNAHAAYSEFRVGAAVLTSDGTIISGCNVENASYGLTICAERNALVQAVALGFKPGDIVATLIYTPGNVVHSPCGACRQVMDEILAPEAEVMSCCDSDHRKSWSMSDLIPDPFRF